MTTRGAKRTNTDKIAKPELALDMIKQDVVLLTNGETINELKFLY